MPDPAASSRGWMLPVFAAVAASAAVGFAFLYLVRPNSGELGAIRVVVSDEDGKTGNTVHITVAEAPFVQKEGVVPGQRFSGQEQFPQPYRLPPHIKLQSSGKRLYETTAVTEFGFSWMAKPLPEDMKEEVRKDAGFVESILGTGGLMYAQANGKLKLGLVFEDFTWEAKGVRMPLASLPLRTHEQKGGFSSIHEKEAPVMFELPYAGPPHVELGGFYSGTTIITEVTATGFRWKNVAKERQGNEGTVTWTAKGVLAEKK